MKFNVWCKDRLPTLSEPRLSHGIEAVLSLSAEGCTVPFMARYRKERTGNLDEKEIADILEAKEDWDKVLNRKAYILEQIEKQGVLTPELKNKIETSFDAAFLEDLFLPYKPKKRSKASLAKEAGLTPLADWMWNIGHGTDAPHPGQTLELWALTFRSEPKGFADAAAVIEGASHILIERISENLDLRSQARTQFLEKGFFASSKGKKAKDHSKFQNYFDFREAVSSLLIPENSHRYLALRRGWIEEELSLNLGLEPEELASLSESFRSFVVPSPECPADLKMQLEFAAQTALKAHVIPSIETEVHASLRKVADTKAIAVFAENLKRILLASPFGAKAVLGVDPGIRTGCKLAVVDDSGKYIASTVMHLQSDDQKEKAKALLLEVCKTGNIKAIAVGNGTGGREAESFIRKTLKGSEIPVPVVMVSESGASIYSASDVARQEYPDLDLTIRGAISIAHRLQDPLAELIKVDPKSIGVGQYQHDVSQPQLKRGLESVVSSCVHSVGVNLNTASPYLLATLSGIGEGLAKAIVEHRSEKGLFTSREDLKSVSGFGPKTFELAAGFLRVPESSNPLDNTGIHPEHYPALESVAKKAGKTIKDLIGDGGAVLEQDSEARQALGEFTLKDVVDELKKPGRDPRSEFHPTSFRDDLFELSDLKPGMICPGVVTNVTQFGAFVDVGVHQDGLVHLSQISARYVKDPTSVIHPGDAVTVRVLEVNLEKKQISLTMKGVGEDGKAPEKSKGKRPAKRSKEDRPAKQAKQEPKLTPSDGPKIAPRQTPLSQQPQATASRNLPKPVSPGAKPGKGPKVQPRTPFNNAFAGLANLRNKLDSDSSS